MVSLTSKTAVAGACVLATAVLAGCSGHSSQEVVGGTHFVLTDLPADFALVGSAEFPTGDATIPDYKLTLFGADTSSVPVGVYWVADSGDCTPGAVRLREDLNAYVVCTSGTEVVVATRGDDAQALAEVVEIQASGRPVLAGYSVLADQAHARVPGFGSLPISHWDTGNVEAYVKEGTGGIETDQVSIAVGAYEGQPDDVVILDWWFDGDKGPVSSVFDAVYQYSALAAADGEPVPTATLGVVREQDGTVVVIRTTDGVNMTPEDIYSDLRRN